ncbi:hypothetical protein MSAN_00377400 [Mycena sanguinolenta]|uniref:CipC protein n=1 Tax=Mycena sanguinolenta TaxID=230812 RepID=A0A8H6Z9C1_9AGAR|nr:hypothetical protein MSAN_00377400 [Mycena sanguinolenta]
MDFVNHLFGGSSDQENQYNEFNSTPKHSADMSHELLAGAASFAAAKAYADHCKKNGKPTSHAEAKELLAGFAGAFLTHEAETRGRDAIDAHKQKVAQEKAEKQLEETFVEEKFETYNP